MLLLAKLLFEHRIVGSVFVEVSQCGIVEAHLVEQIGCGVHGHCEQANVDDFRGLFPKHMDAKQSHIVAVKEELEKSNVVADDFAARNVRVSASSSVVRNVLGGQ